MTTATPNSRDSEAKLQHILRVAAQTFAEQGFEGTSIRDISRATGISLSGLYYYFESKQKLLYLIQNTTFIFILQRVQARLEQVEDPEARLRILVQNHIEYFLSHPNEMKVLSHEEDALEPPYREEVAAIKRQYYALAREIFDSLAKEGLAAARNPRIAVLSLFGMMNWVYKWHNSIIDPDAQELTDAIVGIFLHGVRRVAAGESALSAAGSPAISSD
jgi:TetR/AcrR family transcriptional regulator, cholesterol catabolism regulator